MFISSDGALLLEELEKAPGVFGYEIPPEASLEEKVQIRHQHVVSLLERLEAAGSQTERLGRFGSEIADRLQHLAQKTETRSAQVLAALATVAETLRNGASAETAEAAIHEVVSQLQFLDIHHQQISLLETTFRGFSEFFSNNEGLRVLDLFQMLPEALESIAPRADLDAEDVEPEARGERIELF